MNAHHNASNGPDYQIELLSDFDNETLICFTLLAYVGQDIAVYCRNSYTGEYWKEAQKHFNEVMSILEKNGLQKLINSSNYNSAIEMLSLWLSKDVYKTDEYESYIKSLFDTYLLPQYEAEKAKNKQSDNQLMETEKQQASTAS